MALEKSEIEWITYIAGRDLEKEKSAVKGRVAKKEAFLGMAIGKQLASVRDEIDRAQDFSVTLDKNKKAKGSNVMKWRADDADTNKGILTKYELRADVEVDTVADINVKNAEIPMEQLAALEQAFGRIKEIEKSMRLQFDDLGQPLFTEDDIRNELWTPMVRSGLIPDNFVPDTFSEHAVAFEGARALYAEKIEAYSANRTKTQDKLMRGLRISKEVVGLAGTLASGVITIANVDDVASKKNEIAAANKQLNALKDSGASDVDIQAQRDAIGGLKGQLQALEKMSGYAEAGATMLMGGLGMIEAGVEHHYADDDVTDKQKWVNTFKKGLGEAQKLVGAAIDTGMRGGTSDGGYNLDGMITCVKCATNAAFTGVNMGATIALVAMEKDKSKRLSLINEMIGDLASAVADSINSYGGKVANGGTTEDYQVQAHLQKIAAGLKLAITQAGKATSIYEAIKNQDVRALAMLLGGAAASVALGASVEKVYGSIREDLPEDSVGVLSEKDALYKQDVGGVGQYTQEYGVAGQLETIESSITAIDKSALEGLKSLDLSKLMSIGSQDELQKELDDAAASRQKKLAEERMAEALTPEAMKAVFEDADAEVALFGKIYSDAFPDPDLPEKPTQEILQAQKAIERAMANTEALRQRVALINGLTGTAASILAAIVPGTGAVVAAQKVAADIYKLIKCVETHNAWCDSMSVAMAGQGGATAAIENTLTNARIHLSHASVKLVLDTLKCSAEVARVFDPTGAATATSAGATMAGAVVDFGYAMHTERAIDQGWKAYKEAISNKGNRKAARQALRMNSTLAKCCIAYGASIMGDIAAKEAISKSGLTIAALKDDKDICVRLVNYLEHQLNEDPNVMKVAYATDFKWQPGTPRFALESWSSFKAAAAKSAEPPLARESLETPGVDRLLAQLARLETWSDSKAFKAARDKLAADDPDPDSDKALKDPAGKDDLLKELREAIDLLSRLSLAFSAYAPMADSVGHPQHKDMAEVAATFATMARGNLKVAQDNLKLVQRYPTLV